MTFEQFAHAIAVGVKERQPKITFPLPGRHLKLGPAIATITLDNTHWKVTFKREGDFVGMSPLLGSTFSHEVASNVAISIAVFLEP